MTDCMLCYLKWYILSNDLALPCISHSGAAKSCCTKSESIQELWCSIYSSYVFDYSIHYYPPLFVFVSLFVLTQVLNSNKLILKSKKKKKKYYCNLLFVSWSLRILLKMFITFYSQQTLLLQAHSSSVRNPMLNWLGTTEQE